MNEEEFKKLPLEEKMKHIPKDDQEVVDMFAEDFDIKLSMLKEGISEEQWLDFWRQIGHSISIEEHKISNELYQICKAIREGHNESKEDGQVRSESKNMEMFWGMGRANYLTIPRSIIQEMPVEWQDTLADLMFELDETVDWRPKDSKRYFCIILDEENQDKIDEVFEGSAIHDPLSEYKHGNELAKHLFQLKKESD